jgi:hypothetical protein
MSVGKSTMKKIKNPPEISQNQPTIWTFYHCSSLFKYCDIVIKHCYKTFSMFGPIRGLVFRHSVFRRSVPLDVRSHSTFGPIRRSVFRCSVPFEVRSFDVRSFSMFGLSRFGLSTFSLSMFSLLRFGLSRFGHGFPLISWLLNRGLRWWDGFEENLYNVPFLGLTSH